MIHLFNYICFIKTKWAHTFFTVVKLWKCCLYNETWFQSFVSDPVKRDPILDQFSMITRPYTRLNGLKTILFPVAHTCIAKIWEYPPIRIRNYFFHLLLPTTVYLIPQSTEEPASISRLMDTLGKPGYTGKDYDQIKFHF